MVGNTIVSVTGKNEKLLIVCIMIPATVLSSAGANTGTIACLMPVALGVSMASGIPAGRLLMPLAFAAGLGGIVTLVGGIPNIIAAAALKRAGFAPYSFFEFAKIGVPTAVAGICYMAMIGRRFLPHGHESGESGAPNEEEDMDTAKMFICGLVLLMVGTTMLLNLYQVRLEKAATLGAVICIITGCIKPQRILKSIDWTAIALLLWSMLIGVVVAKSGFDKVLIDFLLTTLGTQEEEWIIVLLLFTVSCGISQFLPNSVAATLLSPVGLMLAEKLQASPQFILLVIALGTSCAFATPIGSVSNIFIFERGGYKFTDYMKCGLGMSLVCLLVALLVVPVIWDFF